MKYCTRVFLVILLALSVTLYGTTVTYNVRYDQSDLTFETEDTFDIVSLKGASFMGNVGKPMLPVKYLNLIIPKGTVADSVSITVRSRQRVSGKYHIYPAQEPINSESEIEFVEPDTSVYNSNALYPAEKAKVIETNNLGGTKIAQISVYPLKYRPESGELTLLTDFTVEVETEFGSEIPSKPLKRTAQSYGLYKKSIYSIVDNKMDVSAFIYKPTIVENKRGTDSKGIVTNADYVIITSSALENSFKPLKKWLTKKGIEARIITLEEIYNDYSGDPISGIYDNAGAIRSFLSDCYEEGLLQWALLGGNYDVVPVRHGWGNNNATDWQYHIPADLYYSDFDGDWEVDSDGRYGEPEDDVGYGAEIYVGRVTANNPSEVENWLEKLFCYEKNPGNGDYSYLTDVLWLAADQARGWPGQLYDHFPGYFSHDFSLIEEESPELYPPGSLVVDSMSSGYGIVDANCHGQSDGIQVAFNKGDSTAYFVHSIDTCDEFWYHRDPADTVYFGIIETANSFDSLDNEGYYSVFYAGFCCHTASDCGWPPFPSFNRAYLTFEKKGGPSYLGNTRYGWSPYNRYLQRGFFDLLFQENIMRQGITEATSKEQYQGYYSHYIKLSHNLLGCPEMPIWTDTPEELIVDYQKHLNLPDSGTVEYEVEVTREGGSLDDSATVCLWKGSEVYAVDYASNIDAGVLFNISPETEGWMYLTVTGPNYIPVEDSVYVFKGLAAATNTSGATKSNAQKMLRHIPSSGNDIALIYSLGNDSIAAVGSPDFGETWASPSFMAEGELPSLTVQKLTPDYIYHWTGTALNSDSNSIFASNGTTAVSSQDVVPEEWDYQTLYEQTSVNPLVSSSSDRGDYLHVGMLYRPMTIPPREKVRYRKYELLSDGTWNLVADELVCSESDIDNHSHPATTVDLNGIPHLVWEWDGEILYATKFDGRWVDPPVVLSDTSRYCKEPYIEYRGDRIKAVWVEEDDGTGKGDIVTREREIDGEPDEWSKLIYIRDSENDSRYPQFSGGYYSWCEKDSEWEAYLYDGQSTTNVSSDSVFDDKYPQIDYHPDTALYYAWTKSANDRSCIAEKTYYTGGKKRTTFVKKAPYYTVEGGDTLGVKRVSHRDSIVTAEGERFDCGIDSLSYTLPFIDSTRLFTLEVRGYSGGLSPLESSSGELKVLIDGQEVKSDVYTASIPRIKLEIPRELYRRDEELTLTVKSQKDQFAMIREIKLFDEEILLSRNEKRGIEDKKEKVKTYYLTTKDRISIGENVKIEFGLPRKEDVKLNVYDCTGRRITNLVSKSLEPGVHSVSWSGTSSTGKALSSGVYFIDLNTERKNLVRKILLIR